METTNFKKEKIQSVVALPKSVISDIKLDVGQDGNDYISDILVTRLSGFIYSNTIDERDLTYYCKPPTFLDWLFRREKKVVFKFKAKDLLLEPPTIKDKTIRVFEINR